MLGIEIARSREHKDTRRDAYNALEGQKAPPVPPARCPDRRDNREYTVNKCVGGENEHERQHRWSRKEKRDQPEYNAKYPPQRHCPPVLSQDRIEWIRRHVG